MTQSQAPANLPVQSGLPKNKGRGSWMGDGIVGGVANKVIVDEEALYTEVNSWVEDGPRRQTSSLKAITTRNPHAPHNF